MTNILRKLTLFLSFAYITGHAQHTKHKPVRASFYAPKFEGRRMANGQRYIGRKLSAASLSFPLGSDVRVTNVRNGLSIVVKITDRGPWHTRFKIDLSRAAFEALGFCPSSGWGWVTVQAVR